MEFSLSRLFLGAAKHEANQIIDALKAGEAKRGYVKDEDYSIEKWIASSDETMAVLQRKAVDQPEEIQNQVYMITNARDLIQELKAGEPGIIRDTHREVVRLSGLPPDRQNNCLWHSDSLIWRQCAKAVFNSLPTITCRSTEHAEALCNIGEYFFQETKKWGMMRATDEDKCELLPIAQAAFTVALDGYKRFPQIQGWGNEPFSPERPTYEEWKAQNPRRAEDVRERTEGLTEKRLKEIAETLPRAQENEKKRKKSLASLRERERESMQRLELARARVEGRELTPAQEVLAKKLLDEALNGNACKSIPSSGPLR